MRRSARSTAVVQAAAKHAAAYLEGLPDRRVVPAVSTEDLAAAFGGPLPQDGADPVAVVEELARIADPGLAATGSGRFFGFVIGGALPAGVGAEILASAWDQNAALRVLSPANAAAEEAAAIWALDLMGLPAGAEVGFVPGGMSANFTCLTAARSHVLHGAGWDVEERGLAGAPRLHVLVGADRHETVDRALRLLGLGVPTPVEADAQGRMRPDALVAALADVPAHAPLIVCLQAGHIHSGDYDAFADLIPLVRDRGGWVHVDGAIGLWAGASTVLRPLLRGVADADSWATDAHKTLNVPYDCGLAIVADRHALVTALSQSASYVIRGEALEPVEKTVEWSRRARGFAIWAVLRSLGCQGVDDLVTGLHHNALAFAGALGALPGVEVLHDVASTQVTFAVGDDARTRAVVDHILADGSTWISGSRWPGRAVVRVSVSNWSTDADDIAGAVAVVRRALASVP